MPMNCVSVDARQYSSFDNNYIWEWSNDAVDIIFTTFHYVKALSRKYKLT